MRSHRLQRIRIALLGSAIGLLCVLAGVVLAADLSIRAEQRLRRESLAQRVFGELEGRLNQLIADEESRRLRDWKRSPKPAVQSQGFVHYVQLAPGEALRTVPLQPGPGLREIAGTAPPPQLLDRLHGELLAIVDNDTSATSVPSVHAKQTPTQAAVPPDLQAQRALDQRQIMRQRAQISLGNALPDPDEVQRFLGQVPQATPGPAVDVEVGRFAGAPIDDHFIRLARKVRIAQQAWVQAIVIEQAGLQAWLAAEVLGDPAIRDLVTLLWNPPHERHNDGERFEHQFPPPFQDLSAAIELPHQHSFESGAGKILWLLGPGLALALVACAVAVDRTLVGMVQRGEERERFVAAVTHELKTPLTSLQMYSEMLESGMVCDPGRQKQYHSTMRRESARLSRLVDQVLSLARMEQGLNTAALEGPKLALADVLDSIVELMQPIASEKQISITIDMPDDLRPAKVPGDPWAQVLTNVIDNAIKFSPSGAPNIELCVRKFGHRGLRVRVRDHGPGVDAETLPRIFEAFVRSKAADKQATPGTGIGLAVVHQIMEQLGGRVSARNWPGGGLELTLEATLPG